MTGTLDSTGSNVHDATDGAGALLLEGEGPVRQLTISSPTRMNAIDSSMHTRLTTIWREIASDPTIGAIVLTGHGRAFSSGGDFEMLSELSQDEVARRRTLAEAEQILDEMLRFPLPIVAAVNGGAVGLGASLAISSDVVLISDKAYMADPHVRVGVVAGDGGAAMWPLLTSLVRTREYLYTGDRISPTLAVEMGLASRVVPQAELMTEAHRVASRLAELPRRAFELTKRAVNLHLLNATRAVMPFAIAAEHLTFRDDDVKAVLRGLRGV